MFCNPHSTDLEGIAILEKAAAWFDHEPHRSEYDAAVLELLEETKHSDSARLRTLAQLVSVRRAEAIKP
jgi:hypothetical protein